jgi:putative ABC transport system permease protein
MSLASISPSVQVGFAALRVNPLRTTLSALGVIIGVGAMVSVLSLSDGVESAVREQIARDGRLQSIGVAPIVEDVVDGQRFPRAQFDTLSSADARALSRQLNGTGTIYMIASGPGYVSAPGAAKTARRAASISATLASGSARAGMKLDAGRFFTDADVQSKLRVAVISRQLAEAVFGKSIPSASAVGRSILIQDSLFTVIGIWTPEAEPGSARRGSLLAYIPVTLAESGVIPIPVSAGSGYTIKARRIEDMPVMQRTVESWLSHRYGNWRKVASISSYADESARLRDNMVIFKLLMSAITGISLVVGGVGIMNVLLASVTERTREIGVRKATGARNRDLLAQFLAESVAIAGLGSVLGTLLGIAVSALVASIMRARTMAQVHAGFSVSTLLVAIAAPIIVGIAFGIYPALRAARLSPIDAIRHE